MTNNASATILNASLSAILQSVVQGIELELNGFQIGDAYGYTLDPNASGVLNSTQFTGDASYVSVSTIGNTLSYTISLPENVGNFTMGNVMLFLTYSGVVTPFIQCIFPSPIQKTATAGGVVGNFIEIRLTADFTSSVSNVEYSLNVTNASISNLPTINSELILPVPNTSAFQQLIIDSFSTTDRPAVAMRRALDNSWYANGLMQRVTDHRFGWIHGGCMGDSYTDFNGPDTWGGFFTSQTTDFISTVDGGEGWAVGTAICDGGSF